MLAEELSGGPAGFAELFGGECNKRRPLIRWRFADGGAGGRGHTENEREDGDDQLHGVRLPQRMQMAGIGLCVTHHAAGPAVRRGRYSTGRLSSQLMSSCAERWPGSVAICWPLRSA